MAKKKAMIPCAEVAQHTPEPDGYIAWHFWADEMGKTHDQQRCSGCGLWKIWVTKQATAHAATGQGETQKRPGC